MPSKKILFIFTALAVIISSCNQPYQGSQNTSSNPTATQLFDDRPLPNEFNLDDLKTGTAAAASGPSNTPGSVLITITATTTFNPNGPTSTATATAQPGVVCTAPACGAGQTLVCPSGNCPNACGLVCSGVTATFTPLTPGAVQSVVRPATWTLHEGEFPWCIARRFDVDPTELLRRSGLSEGSLYSAGTVLTIPQTGPFPGPRALIPHPATYKVISAEETFYSIACLYGDPHPQRIADANGLPISSVLFAGQTISIP